MKKHCKLEKKSKHIPYGSLKKGLNRWRAFWCGLCDAHGVLDISKKRERQRAKKEIRKELI